MTPPPTAPLSPTERHWTALQARTSPAARRLLTGIVEREASALADLFYQNMLVDEQAREFLTHEDVQTRLHASMQRWLRRLFSGWDATQVPELVALQRHVGQVHARINVRGDLVMRGARLITQALGRLIIDAPDAPDTLPTEARVEALLAAFGLMDLAMEVMSAQYFASHEVAARADEAYRSFAASMNMSLERERQRAALLDWQGEFLQEVMAARSSPALPRISLSSFGLWIHHKATTIFGHSSELPSIVAAMARIDESLLPMCLHELQHGEPEELRRLVRQVVSEVGQIRFLEDTLFERLVDLEVGRDALTQLLNRRFLPSILSREIEFSRNGHKPFALLLVDVDHFKAINDSHGHDAGDRVLQHLANVLVNAVRSGDFVFRYGGEEFLVIGVEMTPEQALQVAEKIRRSVEGETFLLSNQRELKATISIGVAPHDGHPDYQCLIERADRALYAAKNGGRNRCVRLD